MKTKTFSKKSVEPLHRRLDGFEVIYKGKSEEPSMSDQEKFFGNVLQKLTEKNRSFSLLSERSDVYLSDFTKALFSSFTSACMVIREEYSPIISIAYKESEDSGQIGRVEFGFLDNKKYVVSLKAERISNKKNQSTEDLVRVLEAPPYYISNEKDRYIAAWYVKAHGNIKVIILEVEEVPQLAEEREVSGIGYGTAPGVQRHTRHADSSHTASSFTDDPLEGVR